MRRHLLVASLLAAVALPTGTAAARDRFDTQVFALIPRPGFPANAYAAPSGRVYEGTYENPAGDTVASRVLEYSPAGALLRSTTVRGQDLGKAHGVQVATSDGAGRLVLLDKEPPRAVKLDLATDSQTTYAAWPEGSVPNHAAWGPDGSLYVTDYGKPILWRIPPGGGTPEPWLQDARFDGGAFGMTGIALSADHHSLLVGMQSEMGGAAGNPSTGRIFTIPVGTDGKPGPPRQLWESRPADGPDAFGLAQSGRIYVALLLADQLAVIAPDGRELERFPADGANGGNGSPVPFDSPSNVRFSGDRVLVANQSNLQGDPTHQAILDVFAAEPGLPELIPPDPELERAVAAKAAAQRAAARRARAERIEARRTAARRARERARARRAHAHRSAR